MTESIRQWLQTSIQWNINDGLYAVARPTNSFWNKWKTNKQDIKDAGVIVHKKGSSWELIWPKYNIVDQKSFPDINPVVTSDLEVPAPPNLKYCNYQKAAIEFIDQRDRVLLADEPGLGKTIETIGFLNLRPEVKHVLIVCPASLRLNWLHEFSKWYIHSNSISSITKDGVPDVDIIVASYEMASKYSSLLSTHSFDLIVLDEAHYCKNLHAIRTKKLLGDNKAHSPLNTTRWLFLTGTPLLNRPTELWTLVRTLDPDGLGLSWRHFHTRYCDAYLEHTRYGTYWDTTGASNLEELRYYIFSKFGLRRLKSQVLSELPSKIRQLIPLDPQEKSLKDLLKKQKKIYEQLQVRPAILQDIIATQKETSRAYKKAVSELQTYNDLKFVTLPKLRYDIGVAKIPYVIQFLESILEEEHKVVVFAYHHDVIDGLAAHFGDIAVRFIGGMSDKERNLSVELFQNTPSIRVFLGNLMAAGVGITLTAASRVVFAESDWTPSILTQCEDRLHRLGQKNVVLAQHLVFDGSLDAYMMKTVLDKQQILDQTLGDPA